MKIIFYDKIILTKILYDMVKIPFLKNRSKHFSEHNLE